MDNCPTRAILDNKTSITGVGQELVCCFPRQANVYIGMDAKCQKNCVLCIEHSPHTNSQGLLHPIMSFNHFKLSLNEKKFSMQQKTNAMCQNLCSFIDKLIQQLKDLKLKKTLQISMLWLRELADSQNQLTKMQKLFRGDFNGIKCTDIYEIYGKIIHNDQLYGKPVPELPCYKGMSQALSKLSTNQKIISQKMSQIQGVLEGGKILRQYLPEGRDVGKGGRQVMLEGGTGWMCKYNQGEVVEGGDGFWFMFSKYALERMKIYEIGVQSKYGNVMIGVVGSDIKQNPPHANVHHNQRAIIYNCSNGNTYHSGMFTRPKTPPPKPLQSLKLLLTSSELIILQKDSILSRVPLDPGTGGFFMAVGGRTRGDRVRVWGIGGADREVMDEIAAQKKQQPEQMMVEEMIHEDVGIEAELVKSRMKDFGDSIIEEEAEASVSNFGNKTNQQQKEQQLDASFKGQSNTINQIQANKTNSIRSEISYPQKNSQIRNSQIFKNVQNTKKRIDQIIEQKIRNSDPRGSNIRSSQNRKSEVQGSEIRGSEIRGSFYNIQIKDEQGGILSRTPRNPLPEFNNSAIIIKDELSSKQSSSSPRPSSRPSDTFPPEKSMHLQAIRQKFVEGAKRLSERESKEGKELSFKSLERQNVSKIDSFYFKPEKSSSNGDIFGSGGNASKIKINISDQVSDIHGRPMQVEASNTLSILNKFRRGSDNIDLLGFEGRGEKEKGVLEMSQSMQASSNIGEQVQNIRDIKTPPKIWGEGVQAVNDSFDF